MKQWYALHVVLYPYEIFRIYPLLLGGLYIYIYIELGKIYVYACVYRILEKMEKHLKPHLWKGLKVKVTPLFTALVQGFNNTLHVYKHMSYVKCSDYNEKWSLLCE